MMTEDPYADIAPFYDLEFESFDADLDLYVGYANRVGGPVLELGCGTGRLLVPLAEEGFQTYGIDNSPAMIELATGHIQQAAVQGLAEAFAGDMRDLSAFRPNTFRLVFAAINSFLHVESREDQLASLGAIRSVLDRDGLLVLDVFNPAPEVLTRMNDQYTFDGAWQTGEGEHVERFSYRHVDSVNQIVRTTLFYGVTGRDGLLRRRSTTYQMRYVHRFELEGLLAQAGFELEGLYGSYSLDPLEDGSEQMIVVAHRTANPGEPS